VLGERRHQNSFSFGLLQRERAGETCSSLDTAVKQWQVRQGTTLFVHLDVGDRHALLHRLVRQAKTVEILQRARMYDGRSGLLDRTGFTVHDAHPNSVPGQLQRRSQAAWASAGDKDVRLRAR
jgi:hypothetical protein